MIRYDVVAAAPALSLTRRLIIQWVTVWVTPFEFSFDLIEAELHRRGVAVPANTGRGCCEGTGPRSVLPDAND
jgi:hypothetical protein